MILRRVVGMLVALLVLAGTGMPAHAQSAAENIRSLLEQRDREIKEILGETGSEIEAEERERLKTVINENIDFRAMGRRALGPHWGDLSEAQREDFLCTFSEVVRSQSLADLEIYRSRVSYEQIEVSGDSAYVRTINYQGDTEIPVAYEMERKEASWRVTDIVIDEVSTAESYARSFQTVIRKRGFETLMQSLRKKLNQDAASQEESST